MIFVSFVSAHAGTYLTSDKKFNLTWWQIDSTSMSFEITSKSTTGWVAFGITKKSNTAHRASDFLGGWVDDNGVVTCGDFYSNKKVMPVGDKSQVPANRDSCASA